MSPERALSRLRERLPSGAIVTDRDVCEAYARDESETPPRTPDAVVRVKTTAHVAETMRAASDAGVPVTPRAAGTGRTGGAVPVDGGWVLSFEGMQDVLEVSRADSVAVVEPGVVLGALHSCVEHEGLFYPPDANSLSTCTLGGNIAENAGGPRACKYGVTRDYVLGLEVVLADGTIVELGRRTKKGVTGYDLTSLMVGSEGTLGLVTRATLRLVPRPESLRTLLAYFGDEADVAPALAAVDRAGIVPRCAELLDRVTLDVLREDGSAPVPEGARAMLLVEIDGADERLDGELERLGAALDDAGAIELLVAKHAGERERLWAGRRAMSRSLRRRAAHKISEDVVVPRSQLGALLARCRALSETHRIVMPTYGHAGDGNLHVNFLWDTDEEKTRVDRATVALFEATIALGGTLSGEHGIGVAKAPFLSMEQSPELIALGRSVKATFDPSGILNPGKIFARTGHGAC